MNKAISQFGDRCWQRWKQHCHNQLENIAKKKCIRAVSTWTKEFCWINFVYCCHYGLWWPPLRPQGDELAFYSPADSCPTNNCSIECKFDHNMLSRRLHSFSPYLHSRTEVSHFELVVISKWVNAILDFTVCGPQSKYDPINFFSTSTLYTFYILHCHFHEFWKYFNQRVSSYIVAPPFHS